MNQTPQYKEFPSIAVLPPELLSEIFALVCHHPSCQHLADEIDPNSPSFSTPLFLGKICGYWRDLAWSTPSLWTCIDLVLPITNQDLYAQLLEEWLGRSKSLPLSITFRRDESVKAGNVSVWGEQTLPLFHLITNEWRRWEYIDLFIPHGFCTLRLDSFESKDMRLLHTARLRGLQGASSESPGPSFLSNAVNLRELFFRGKQFPPLITPYRQLTSVTVNSLCISDIMHVITHSPNLMTLCIMESTGPFIALPGPEQQKICLEYLTSLTVINCRSGMFSPFLDTLDLPSLLHLHLEGGSPWIPFDLNELSSFMRCNGHALQSLVLTRFTAGRAGNVLKHTPSLMKLTLCRESSSTADSVAFQENLADGLTQLLPELDYFEFPSAIAPHDVILDALKKRWRTGEIQVDGDDDMPVVNKMKAGRIQTVIFSASLGKEWQALTREYLKGEVEEGMDLRFAHWVPTPTTY